MTGGSLIDKVDMQLVKKSFESLDFSMVNFAHATKREDLLKGIKAADALKDVNGVVNSAKYLINGEDEKSSAGTILEHYYNILYQKEKVSDAFMQKLLTSKIDEGTDHIGLPPPLQYVPDPKTTTH